MASGPCDSPPSQWRRGRVQSDRDKRFDLTWKVYRLHLEPWPSARIGRWNKGLEIGRPRGSGDEIGGGGGCEMDCARGRQRQARMNLVRKGWNASSRKVMGFVINANKFSSSEIESYINLESFSVKEIERKNVCQWKESSKFNNIINIYIIQDIETFRNRAQVCIFSSRSISIDRSLDSKAFSSCSKEKRQ